MKTIITATFATITTLFLASCEGITASYKGEAIDAEYSAKGGLIIYPKVPQAIQVVDPAK